MQGGLLSRLRLWAKGVQSQPDPWDVPEVSHPRDNKAEGFIHHLPVVVCYGLLLGHLEPVPCGAGPPCLLRIANHQK